MVPGARAIIQRNAVRAILLTPDREILLLRIHEPGTAESFWITPGGGLEPGETIEAGLRRELREELGLEGFAIGPLVWRRQHTFDWAGRRICQQERYHIVAIDRFEPKLADVVESEVVERVQWWGLADLAHATERLTPLSLVEIVSRYLAEGPPRHPLAVEILVD